MTGSTQRRVAHRSSRCSADSCGTVTAAPLALVDRARDACVRRRRRPTRPHPIACRLDVHDPRVYERVLREGSVGLGESYADGWWDTDDLTGFLRLALRSLRTHRTRARDRFHRWLTPGRRSRRAAAARRPDRDARNVRAHYDLGNEFFATAARRDDDVLVRGLRPARHLAGRRVARQARSAGPHCSISRPGDRCSRSAPAGAASPSTRPTHTAAT